jgi:hypothetical protein
MPRWSQSDCPMSLPQASFADSFGEFLEALRDRVRAATIACVRFTRYPPCAVSVAPSLSQMLASFSQVDLRCPGTMNERSC